MSSLSDLELRLVDNNTITHFSSFDCDKPDLNDFFCNDCINYQSELLGKTYFFSTKPSILDKLSSIFFSKKKVTEIVCAFTISNESIKTELLPGSRARKIKDPLPREKHMKHYPAVLIGRLGVNIKYARQGYGQELMDFIKTWFILPTNKTGCRFIVVDAYNESRSLDYYTKNGFNFVFSSEDQEKDHLKLPSTFQLKTRLMYFDLIVLRA